MENFLLAHMFIAHSHHNQIKPTQTNIKPTQMVKAIKGRKQKSFCSDALNFISDPRQSFVTLRQLFGTCVWLEWEKVTPWTQAHKITMTKAASHFHYQSICWSYSRLVVWSIKYLCFSGPQNDIPNVYFDPDQESTVRIYSVYCRGRLKKPENIYI